jgi:hypothetical protein
MRNNIFINDLPSSIEIFNTSIYRLDSTFNVVNTISYTGLPDKLKSLAITLPEGPNTVAGVTRERAAKEFVRYSNEPWVIIEGKWWRLNPDRPDFRPRSDSKLFANWGDRKDLPARDLSGHERTSSSMGAFAPANTEAK